MFSKLKTIKMNNAKASDIIALVASIIAFIFQIFLTVFMALGAVRIKSKLLNLVSGIGIIVDFTGGFFEIAINRLAIMIIYYIIIGFAIKNIVQSIIGFTKFSTYKKKDLSYDIIDHVGECFNRTLSYFIVLVTLSHMVSSYALSSLTWFALIMGASLYLIIKIVDGLVNGRDLLNIIEKSIAILLIIGAVGVILI